MIATTCTCNCTFTCSTAHTCNDGWIVIKSDDRYELQAVPAEDKQEPDYDLFVIERFKGPPPNHQKVRMQRTYSPPLIKRRNHCNIARPRLNLPRLKRQRVMRLLTRLNTR